jgi:hypothetical protein
MPISLVDLLLGFKAIGLQEGLKNTDRRVGFVLLDHFNRNTTQCDPSLETVAALLGVSRRSVIRSVNKLAHFGLVRRVRHGGGFHRNFYEPAWDLFREWEAAWRGRRREQSRRMRAKNLSPLVGHEGHPAGDGLVTQTSSNNQNKQTITSSSTKLQAIPNQEKARGRSKIAGPMNISSSFAAEAAAERRWLKPFQKHFESDPEIYSRVLEHIDHSFVAAITEIERNHPGNGFYAAIDRLKKAKIL